MGNYILLGCIFGGLVIIDTESKNDKLSQAANDILKARTTDASLNSPE